MAEEMRDPQTSTVEGELDAALATLESSLAAAGGAVAAIRDALPQVAALAAGVGEMEVAMARVRQQLGASSGAPSLRSVEPQDTPAAQAQDSPAASPEPDEPPPSVEEAQAEAGGRVSHCLRLDVSTRASSLDLKAVDGSVNENSAVVDVALLDYDGRHATLKIWIEASADPNAVREALLESLQRHLADAEDAEVRIDFEDDPAA